MSDNKALPQTRKELEAWVYNNLHGLLPDDALVHLVEAISALLSSYEFKWKLSKEEAIRALSAGYAERMKDVQTALSAKDATISSIGKYFEDLIAGLQEKAHKDPKTQLINFDRFTEQLESFLAIEQRGDWCAVGLVDIRGFKWYNDAFGHAVGDKIIERVAKLLREHTRSADLIAAEPGEKRQEELHSRFGGDEFCFLVPDVSDPHLAHTIAERFRHSVADYEWQLEDPRLIVQPVKVDVGVVCLALGPVADRRFIAHRLAGALINRADELMYAAKAEKADCIFMTKAKVVEGKLVDIPNNLAQVS